MPVFFNNSIWAVSEDELVPVFYNRARTLHKQIERDAAKCYGLRKVQSGGNGRQLLIAFDSLPAYIQDAIGHPEKLTHILERFYTTDQDAVSFFATHKVGGEYLDAKLQDRYITNASVLQACIKLKAAREFERKSKRGSLKGVMTTIIADAASFNKTLSTKYGVQHTLQVTEKWFKATFKTFLNEGQPARNYASLISKKVGNSNPKKVTDEAMKLLRDMFAGVGHKPTRTEIGRQYDAFLGGYVEVMKNDGSGEAYDHKDFRPLSAATITNYLGEWKEQSGVYRKRSGDRQKYMGQFKPYFSFERPTFAGSVLSIDDRQPPFEYAKGKRLWFYNGVDIASGAFICTVHGHTKEGIIIEFYRQLVRNCIDFGVRLPYELEAESSLNSSFTNTFLRNGAMFSQVRIEANNARGKWIEHINGKLRYSDDEKGQVGWKPRPHARSESNQKDEEKVPMIQAEKIVQIALNAIRNHNNEPHEVHQEKTRWEVFKEMQHPDLAPVNWKAFLPALGYKTETSCGLNGIIQLDGGEYLLGDEGDIYTGESLIGLMEQAAGRSIDVYWLDGNDGKVLKALVYIGDKCICEAIPKPRPQRSMLERTAEDKRLFALMSAYVNTIDTYTRQKAASIDSVVIFDHRRRTLNDKFVMPGYDQPKKYTDDDERPKLLPPFPDEDDDDMMFPASPAPSLKDRF